ncbi:MAG: hypothetical protein ACYC0N_00195 [Carboxydocellales bacterium]
MAKKAIDSLECPICHEQKYHIRSKYVQDILEAEKGELSLLDKEVIRNLKEQNLLARNVNDVFEDQKTLGERIADKVAEFGGSWKFLCRGNSSMDYN